MKRRKIEKIGFPQTNLVSGCVKISLFLFKAIKLKQQQKN